MPGTRLSVLQLPIRLSPTPHCCPPLHAVQAALREATQATEKQREKVSFFKQVGGRAAAVDHSC